MHEKTVPNGSRTLKKKTDENSQEPKQRGPYGKEIADAMDYIFSYLKENSSECQFSLEELQDQIKGEFYPHVKTIKAQLLKKYGDDIMISNTPNKPAVISFRNTGHKILSEAFYREKSTDKEAERKRIVMAAAEIILEDIRSQVYEKENYPLSDEFFVVLRQIFQNPLSLS